MHIEDDKYCLALFFFFFFCFNSISSLLFFFRPQLNLFRLFGFDTLKWDFSFVWWSTWIDIDYYARIHSNNYCLQLSLQIDYIEYSLRFPSPILSGWHSVWSDWTNANPLSGRLHRSAAFLLFSHEILLTYEHLAN